MTSDYTSSQTNTFSKLFHQGEGDSNLSKNRLLWEAGSKNDIEGRKLIEQDNQYFIHQSLSTPCLAVAKKVEGIWVEDTAGRRFMDFHGNNAHHIGYAHPKLAQAIKDQIDELPFAPRRFTDAPAVELAKKISELAPGDNSKVLFATGGSDAIDMAMKLARAATGRHKTISFWDSFHGAGFGGLAVGGESLFRNNMGPMLSGSEHVAPFACYRCPYGYDDNNGAPDLDVCKMTCANMLRYVMEKEKEVAAVIAEPVRAVPYIPPPGFWKAIREVCNDMGTLLIFDEIPNGLGKTGSMFVSEQFDVMPDITVIGKALGGGMLPIAAMIVRPELNILSTQALGHYTHEKNPITTRAALTTIEIIEEEGLVENARVVGLHALERLNEMKERHPIIGNVAGLGLCIGIDLVSNRKDKTPASDIADRVMYRCLNNGLSFKTTMGNILTLTPPLIVTKDQMDQALNIIEEAIIVETSE
jgi:4-aminobutyrate aminotransferase